MLQHACGEKHRSVFPLSMSTSAVSDVASSQKSADVDISVPKDNGNYKGFVGGVFSGLAKLSVG